LWRRPLGRSAWNTHGQREKQRLAEHTDGPSGEQHGHTCPELAWRRKLANSGIPRFAGRGAGRGGSELPRQRQDSDARANDIDTEAADHHTEHAVADSQQSAGRRHCAFGPDRHYEAG
jgi:hypothetical protein